MNFRKGTWFDNPKYIVDETKLISLMQWCRACHGKAVAFKTNQQGAYVQYTIYCQTPDCSHEERWSSTDVVQQKYLINLFLSAAILFSGGLASKFLRALGFLNIQVPSLSTFYRHQKKYLHGVNSYQITLFWWLSIAFTSFLKGKCCIVHSLIVWYNANLYMLFFLFQQVVRDTYAKAQKQLFEGIWNDNRMVALAGDGRCDSPGHCALYGVYSFMDCESCKVLGFELVKVSM